MPLICLIVNPSWPALTYQPPTLRCNTNDPFVIRFKVKPLVWLSKEKAIPIRDDRVWNRLSFTKGVEKNASQWTGKLRSSLNQLSQSDGQFLEQFISAQINGGETFEIDEQEYSKLIRHKVRRPDREVTVSVPQDTEVEVETAPRSEVRESIKIQALLANIGAQMGL
jgi:hypothetical protein